MAGWIAAGGDALSLLQSPTIFACVTLGGDGASVTWDDGQGDLSIDAAQIKKLADEQTGS